MPNTVRFSSGSVEYIYDYDSNQMRCVDAGFDQGFSGWSSREVNNNITSGNWVLVERSFSTEEKEKVDILNDNRQF